jgi:hypothetical protein
MKLPSGKLGASLNAETGYGPSRKSQDGGYRSGTRH